MQKFNQRNVRSNVRMKEKPYRKEAKNCFVITSSFEENGFPGKNVLKYEKNQKLKVPKSGE